ncbi:hypothetical protein [Streptomyces chartreusis]|uniref:hypothetical protein n=1 Tax=Streptomyces chartreusis TaxID=1969 RepID=UPI0033BEBD71
MVGRGSPSVGALRNARRAGIALADQAIYAQHGGKVYASTVLGVDGLFGERALRQTLSAARLAPPHEAARSIVAGLIEHFGSRHLTADAAVVCLDWNGCGIDATSQSQNVE